MTGWSAELECTFEKAVAETANIVGVLEGAGPLAQETIVLGAHYDHIGRGEFGSRKPDVARGPQRRGRQRDGHGGRAGIGPANDPDAGRRRRGVWCSSRSAARRGDWWAASSTWTIRCSRWPTRWRC